MFISISSDLTFGALLPSGEFVTDGYISQLNIKPEKSGSQIFDISSVNQNTESTCQISGIFRKGKIFINDNEDVKKPCKINFTVHKNTIQISTPDYSACSTFCGWNAHFEDLYIKVPHGCLSEEIRNKMNSANELYKTHDHINAKEKIKNILVFCNKTIPWEYKLLLLNNLAMNQYKLGKLKECRKTLNIFINDAKKTDYELKTELSNLYWIAYKPILNSARRSLYLCKDSNQ